MPTFPISLSSLLIAPSPACKIGRGHGKDRHEQRTKRTSRRHVCPRYGGSLGTAAYISIAHLIHVRMSYKQSVLYISERVSHLSAKIIHTECLIVSQQPHTQCVSFNQSSYIIQHSSHSHRSIVYYLVSLLDILVYQYSHPLFETSLRRK